MKNGVQLRLEISPLCSYVTNCTEFYIANHQLHG